MASPFTKSDPLPNAEPTTSPSEPADPGASNSASASASAPGSAPGSASASDPASDPASPQVVDPTVDPTSASAHAPAPKPAAHPHDPSDDAESESDGDGDSHASGSSAPFTRGHSAVGSSDSAYWDLAGLHAGRGGSRGEAPGASPWMEDDEDEMDIVEVVPVHGPGGHVRLSFRMPESAQWRRYVRCVDGEWQIMALRAKPFGDGRAFSCSEPMVIDSVERVVQSLPGSTAWAAAFVGLDAPVRGWDGRESLWSYAKRLDVPVTRVLWLLRLEQELRAHFVDGAGRGPIALLVEQSELWPGPSRIETGASIPKASLLPREIPSQETIVGLSDAALEAALLAVGIDTPIAAIESRVRHGFSCFAWVERSIEQRLRGRDVLALREPSPAERDLAALAAMELFERVVGRRCGPEKSAEAILSEWHESISPELMAGEPCRTISACFVASRLLLPLIEHVGGEASFEELGKLVDLPLELTDYVPSFVAALVEALPQVPPKLREVIVHVAEAMSTHTRDPHEQLLLRALLAFHGWGIGERKARQRLTRFASDHCEEPLLSMMHIDALTVFDGDAAGHRDAARIADRLAHAMDAVGFDATEWFARAAAYGHIAEELEEAELTSRRRGGTKDPTRRTRKALRAAHRGDFVPPTTPSSLSGVLPGGLVVELADHDEATATSTRRKLQLVS